MGSFDRFAYSEEKTSFAILDPNSPEVIVRQIISPRRDANVQL
jgi:hypothetical protein